MKGDTSENGLLTGMSSMYSQGCMYQGLIFFIMYSRRKKSKHFLLPLQKYRRRKLLITND